jgi:sulfite reductase beta subunit-like hemoprotein
VAVSFIGGGNRSTQRKPPTCCKSLTNFITMFLVPNIDQMYKEMKKIVEVRNKHGNRDEFLDFADLYIFLA